MDMMKEELLEEFIEQSEELYDELMGGGNGLPLATFPEYLQDSYPAMSPEEVVERIKDDFKTFAMESYGFNDDEIDFTIEYQLEDAIVLIIDNIENEHGVEYELTDRVFYPEHTFVYNQNNTFIDYFDFINNILHHNFDILINVLNVGSRQDATEVEDIESYFPQLDFEEQDVATIQMETDDILNEARDMMLIVIKDLATFDEVVKEAKDVYDKKTNDFELLFRVANGEL